MSKTLSPHIFDQERNNLQYRKFSSDPSQAFFKNVRTTNSRVSVTHSKAASGRNSWNNKETKLKNHGTYYYCTVLNKTAIGGMLLGAFHFSESTVNLWRSETATKRAAELKLYCILAVFLKHDSSKPFGVQKCIFQTRDSPTESLIMSKMDKLVTLICTSLTRRNTQSQKSLIDS